jgi:hypothetical protein
MKRVTGDSAIGLTTLNGDTVISLTTLNGDTSVNSLLSDDFDSQFEIAEGITFDNDIDTFDDSLITWDNG